MNKTNEYRNGVIGVLSLARSSDPEIGSYVQHILNLDFNFSVQLSNGYIQMSKSIAHDYEVQPSSVTPEKIAKVVSTFRKSL